MIKHMPDPAGRLTVVPSSYGGTVRALECNWDQPSMDGPCTGSRSMDVTSVTIVMVD